MFDVTSQTAETTAKKIFRLLESSYGDLAGEPISEFLSAALARTLQRLGPECGIRDVVLLRRDGAGWGPAHDDVRGRDALMDALGKEQISILHATGAVLQERPYPAAIWLLGTRREWAGVLRLDALPDGPGALLLKVAHMAIQQRAQQAEWTGMLDRAKAIQRSLLPDPFPGLVGFDIAARSDSAEDVGGDVFDGIPLGPGTLGLLVADASGHGLPAALEARDVVVGMRMGVARDLKIAATLERLNRILCGSTLSSRFVSLIYGELHDDGEFEYVNAGHPPGLLVLGEETRRLPETGAVLGVLPRTRFRVGHAAIPPGGTLLLYTDGVIECPSPRGEEFGLARLAGMAAVLSDAPAALLASAVFDALAEHSRTTAFPDDASLLVVRRRSAGS